MRGILILDLEAMIKEQLVTLEKVSAEELKKVQGIIQGLRKAQGLLRNRPEIN